MTSSKDPTARWHRYGDKKSRSYDKQMRFTTDRYRRPKSVTAHPYPHRSPGCRGRARWP
jgi:hypothetical protein